MGRYNIDSFSWRSQSLKMIATLWKQSYRNVKDSVDGELQVSHLPLVPPRSEHVQGSNIHASLSSKVYW